MSKNILTIIIITVVIISGMSFAAYQYIYQRNETPLESIYNNEPPSLENSNNKNSNLNEGDPEVEVETNQKGNLLVCVDRCGDGVCQNADTSCEGGNLNCICKEDPQECPQDCK